MRQLQPERTADAVTCYHRAIYGSWPADQAANQVQARFELAAFLAKAGMRTQATVELLAIIDRVPNDTAARKRAGRLLLDYGAPGQSADVFRSLARENNRDAEAYAGLGAVEFAEDQYAAARGAFRSALRFNASDEATQRELALCERILELDPAVRGPGPAERYRRSAALLEAALGRAEQCLPKVSQAADAQPLRTWADTARQSPARQPARRASDGAAESDLSLAEELWAASQKLCGAASGFDAATHRVLVAGDAHLDQIVLGGLRLGIAEHQVVFGRAALVAVTLDRQLVIRKILQDVAELRGVGLERVDRIGT